MVEGLAGVVEDCRGNSSRRVRTRVTWGQRLWSLTLSVDPQHDGSVVGMQVKEKGCADQVLGEIPEERNRPEGNQ